MSKKPTNSSLIRERIMRHLRHEWRWSEGGNSWQSFEALAKELLIPVRDIRREVRKMARLGRLRYSFMCNQDGVPAGSGYFIEPAWERHVPGRAEDPPYIQEGT